MPSKKLKVSIRTPKEAFGSEAYTVFVDVTNVTSKIIEGISVAYQFLPGSLKLREEPLTSELTELQQKKQKIVREMQKQVAYAYENKAMRGKPLVQRLLWRYAKFSRSIEIVPISSIGISVASINLESILPSYAEEALSIEDWDDVERLEKEVISHEDKDSDIKGMFEINKEKLKVLQGKISVTTDKVSLKEVYSIQPGETMTFPFEAIAPLLYRAKTHSLQFKICYKDSTPEAISTFSVNEDINFFPSPFAIYIGALLGAIAGSTVKLIVANSLSLAWSSPTVFWPNIIGCIVLALIFTAITVRTPGSKKVITTEDFIGGIILGTLVGISSKSIFDYLLKLVPSG